MKVVMVLITVFLVALAVTRLVSGEWMVVVSGNIAMCVMLLFTASGHFVFTKGMAMMLPEAIPYKEAWVYITGLLEIAAAVALLIPRCRYAAGIFLVIFFVVLLPANISAALRQVNYQKGDFTGAGPAYLWLRIPMQLFFIAWASYFSIYKGM